MSIPRRAAGGLLAVALVAGTAALSRLPTPFSTSDEALLRLSWRMAGVTAQACRTLSPEELEKLPVHMRNPKACIGHIASYVLRVRVDGVLETQDTVRPAGARGDRPITLLRDLRIAPGAHRVDIAFDALLPEGVEPPPDALRSLVWNGRVDAGPRGVALVTLDPEGRRLEYRTETGRVR
jgi:hypothetical protein